MRFIEIADEEALNLPADQLKAIATYNYLLSVQPDYVPRRYKHLTRRDR
ncbi:MAG: hypothetical protein ACLVBP_15565 [Ruminococcus sp.]